jgi:hypothetical protein
VLEKTLPGARELSLALENVFHKRRDFGNDAIYLKFSPSGHIKILKFVTRGPLGMG